MAHNNFESIHHTDPPLLGDMIPAEELSNVEFANRFPSKGQIPTDPVDGIKDQMNHESILNDIPPKATSCLVYHDNDLQKRRPDPPIYPIPVNFQPYRKLKSLQAVFKTLPGSSDTCIFSHMFVSPEDVEPVLGKGFIRCLKEVQSDVRPNCYYPSLIVDHRRRKIQESLRK